MLAALGGDESSETMAACCRLERSWQPCQTLCALAAAPAASPATTLVAVDALMGEGLDSDGLQDYGGGGGMVAWALAWEHGHGHGHGHDIRVYRSYF